MHTSTYCCESALSTMNMVQNKYRSTLTNEHLHQCLRLALTSLMPKFNAQKGVTFHTNKARPHHLLCIVRTFLLELCFWILTVTVPEPDLNGILASGPFGFLIEYPWYRAKTAIDMWLICQLKVFVLTLQSSLWPVLTLM